MVGANKIGNHSADFADNKSKYATDFSSKPN